MPYVTEVEAFRVALPPARRTAADTGGCERILVRVAGRHGAAGWGEIDPGGEPDACWRRIGDASADALVGTRFERPADLTGPGGVLDPRRHGDDRTATRVAAGLDTACWDLWCRLRDTPLAHAIGGTRTAVAAGITVGREPTVQALVDRVNQQVRGGYLRVTMPIEPGWDIEPVRAVRRAYPGLVVGVDAGGRYSGADGDLTALRALDGYGLSFVESPFPADDLAAHARLQHRIGTPLCLPSTDVDTLDAAAALGAARVLDLRVAGAGGIGAARALHDHAAGHGWQVWCGGGAGFGIGRAANVALASLPGCTLPSDVSGPAKRYTRDVVRPAVRATDGMVPVPLTQPGLGHRVDDRLVRELAGDTVRVTAPAVLNRWVSR